METPNPLQYLPTAEELPNSDETPVDNELQNLIPNLLLSILSVIWENRTDWFFGVDMGIYTDPNRPAIIPDGFLSLGVERYKQRSQGRVGRLCYVLWEENGVLPLFFLEVVSKTYNQEYGEKKREYAELGIQYYAIYDCDRNHSRRGDRFEVYRLIQGEYVRQTGEPVWMPEIGLGIGREISTYRGWTREWLYWYDENGNKYSTPEELAQQAQQQAQQAQQRLDYLTARLQEMGINPEEL